MSIVMNDKVLQKITGNGNIKKAQNLVLYYKTRIKPLGCQDFPNPPQPYERVDYHQCLAPVVKQKPAKTSQH